MLAQYTDMVKGDDDRAAGILRFCFDEAIQLSMVEGGFILRETHPNLQRLFLHVAGSLYFLLQVRQATTRCKTFLIQHANAHKQLAAAQAAEESAWASQSTAAESDLNAAKADVVRARVELGLSEAALQTAEAEKSYLTLKNERGSCALFRYRMVYDALQAACENFNLLASPGPAYGATVIGDHLQTKAKGRLCSIGSSQGTSGLGCKCPAADMQGNVPSMRKRSKLIPVLPEGEEMDLDTNPKC
jgi:hypothetical protein